MSTEIRQQLFSIAQTAKRTGRSVSSTWRDVREGRLKVVYIGGSTKVTAESIDALISGATPKPERAYLVKAHTVAAEKAHEKAAANRERKAAERERLAALERRKAKAKVDAAKRQTKRIPVNAAPVEPEEGQSRKRADRKVEPVA